ncbi:proteinase inhibitor-like [Silene latifolia]|uniref:proteinase inhibitor-like n=1 Tax=Silene latifolia TaxID=37657 RepID=UPI003D76B248
MDCPGKNAWPELVGTNGKFAVETIERENGLVKAIVVLKGSAVTEDFRCDRVRVWVNSLDIVYEIPVIG